MTPVGANGQFGFRLFCVGNVAGVATVPERQVPPRFAKKQQAVRERQES